MIKNLIKLRLRAVFGAMSGKDKNGAYKKPTAGKIVLFSILYGYLFIAFSFASVAISMGIGSLFVIGGESEIYFAMINAISFSLLFILSIFETKSELFDCKDNDLLLSMPIPSGSIVIARILVVLIYNFIAEAILIIPASIIYLILSGGELAGFFGSLITGFCIPFAATALAAAVGYLVAMISKKMKNKTFVTLFISLVFLALYFYAYTTFLSVDGDGMEVDVSLIAEKLSFLRPIGAASMLSPIPLIVFVAICAGVSYAAYRIISYHYISIVTQDHSLKRTEYKAERMKHASPLIAITKKELSKIVSSATYMLNGALGVVFEVAIAVLVIFKSSDINLTISQLISELGFSGSLDGLILAVISAGSVLLSSTIMLSAASVSLEGKNLWVMRSMPVSGKTVLTAKALTHIIVSVPPAVIAVCVISAVMSLTPLYTLLAVLVAVSANVLCALFGVILNTAFPKFVFENEAQPIKQSLSTFLVMLVMMLLGFGMLIVGAVMAFLSLGVLFTVIALICLCTLSLGFYFIMIYASAKRFDGFSTP